MLNIYKYPIVIMKPSSLRENRSPSGTRGLRVLLIKKWDRLRRSPPQTSPRARTTHVVWVPQRPLRVLSDGVGS